MPCYTEWDTYLDKGSPEYEAKKAEMEAKLKAVKHIVDYYYGIERLRVPPARHSGKKTWGEMAHREFEFDPGELRGKNEESILRNIARHCSCDGIHYVVIYDLVTFLNIHDPVDAGYARIVMICANDMRANGHQYELHTK